MKGAWVCGEVREGLSVGKSGHAFKKQNQTTYKCIVEKKKHNFNLIWQPIYFVWKLKLFYQLVMAISAAVALLISL